MKRHWRCLTSNKGFTLLEVLLAVFIGAIVLTVLYASFFQIINAKDSAEDKLELYHEARVILSKMTDDLSMIYPRGMVYPVQGSFASSFFVGRVDDAEHSSIDFTSLSHIGGIGSRDSDQAQISYYLQPIPQSDLFFLRRRENPNFGNNSSGLDYPLSERVVGFNLMYMRPDDGQFITEWDSVQTNSLPKAVEISLTIRSTKGENIEFNSLVLIPLAN